MKAHALRVIKMKPSIMSHIKTHGSREIRRMMNIATQIKRQLDSFQRMIEEAVRVLNKKSFKIIVNYR